LSLLGGRGGRGRKYSVEKRAELDDKKGEGMPFPAEKEKDRCFPRLLREGNFKRGGRKRESRAVTSSRGGKGEEWNGKGRDRELGEGGKGILPPLPGKGVEDTSPILINKEKRTEMSRSIGKKGGGKWFSRIFLVPGKEKVSCKEGGLGVYIQKETSAPEGAGQKEGRGGKFSSGVS